MINTISNSANFRALRQMSGDFNETTCSQARWATENAALRKHVESLAYSLLACIADSLLACIADDLSRSEEDVVESAMQNQYGGEPCRSVS